MKFIIVATLFALPVFSQDAAAPSGDWSIRGEVVEAAAPGGRFLTAFRITDGQVRGVALDGARIAVAGDRGARVVVFDPSVTEEQRTAVEAAIREIFPQDWAAPRFETRAIDWESRDGRVLVRIAGRGEIRFEPRLDSRGQPLTRRIRYGITGHAADGHPGTAIFSYVGDGLELKDVRSDAFATWVNVERWESEGR